MEEGGGGDLRAAGSAQRRLQIGDLDAGNFLVEINTAFWDQERFLIGGAGIEQLLGKVLGKDGA